MSTLQKRKSKSGLRGLIMFKVTGKKRGGLNQFVIILNSYILFYTVSSSPPFKKIRFQTQIKTRRQTDLKSCIYWVLWLFYKKTIRTISTATNHYILESNGEKTGKRQARRKCLNLKDLLIISPKYSAINEGSGSANV